MGLQAKAGQVVEAVCTVVREHDNASVPTDAKECTASATEAAAAASHHSPLLDATCGIVIP